MNHTCRAAVLAVALLGFACGGNDASEETSRTSEPAGSQDDSTQVAFSEADLDKFALGLRKEIDAVKAAQQQAASAANAQARGEAIQAQFETATIPSGAAASGLSEARYRGIREQVDRVFTTLDFQGKIDGPLSIDLERSDPQMKARVSGDAFDGLPSESATALRARMDQLVPVWSEYKTLVAVAG